MSGATVDGIRARREDDGWIVVEVRSGEAWCRLGRLAPGPGGRATWTVDGIRDALARARCEPPVHVPPCFLAGREKQTCGKPIRCDDCSYKSAREYWHDPPECCGAKLPPEKPAPPPPPSDTVATLETSPSGETVYRCSKGHPHPFLSLAIACAQGLGDGEVPT